MPAPPNGNPQDPGYDVVGTPGARAVGMAPPGVNYSNFMDTRLSWTFGDDDFLHPTGQLIPLSPTFSIGDRQQYRLFFDSLNSQYAGRENLTHLVMYKKMPGFIPRLTTEAAVVLRFDLTQLAANNNNINQALYDAGSYIRISYQTGKTAKEGLSATFFPLDTDRFRLGYLYDISWGGTNANLNQSIFPGIQGSAPGLKLQFDAKDYYAFLGFKTAMIVQPEQILNPGGTNQVQLTNIAETNYGFLGGLGIDAAKFLRLDAGAGYFQQGKQNIDDVRGDPVYTYGASGRNRRPPGHAGAAVGRLLALQERPERADDHVRADKVQPARGRLERERRSRSARATPQELRRLRCGGGSVRLRRRAASRRSHRVLAPSATGITRDLNYVVRNVPGFIPFETMPQNAKSDPEIFGALSADYYIPSLRLTPGLGGGIQLPSTFQSEFSDGGVPASAHRRRSVAGERVDPPV